MVTKQKFTMGHPMIREFYGESKEMYMPSKEMPRYIRHFSKKYGFDEK